MPLFPIGHATHPQWHMACALVLAQLHAHMALHGGARTHTLGLLYITDHYAPHAREMLERLRAELPHVCDWSGAVGVGVCATGAEYIDEPALSVMLCALPEDQYRVFSGVTPLAGNGFRPHAALVHADAATPELPELLAEMAGRTTGGYLFGGLATSRTQALQFAVGRQGNAPGQGEVTGVFSGGLSGVGFGEGVSLVSRVTQGCQPIAPERIVTAADGNVILQLDGQPALDVMLADLEISLQDGRHALAVVRQTLLGLSGPGEQGVHRTGNFGADVRVRHIIGVDPSRHGVAIAQSVVVTGQRATFCRRNPQAARADLMRICAEIREDLEPEEMLDAAASAFSDSHSLAASTLSVRRMLGAVYVSCAGRGGAHFGAPGAELQIVHHALGDVPLVGFFAGGEIARHHLYGYTGVLTVFVGDGLD